VNEFTGHGGSPAGSARLLIIQAPWARDGERVISKLPMVGWKFDRHFYQFMQARSRTGYEQIANQ
jgi:hypothetical protein